ncbi:MAG: zf-HC2 domain-containing protein, partial [Planctomycetota bacterium]
MECKEARENLTLYLLGDLHDAQAQDVEKHLSRCDECRSEEGRFHRALDGLSALPEVDGDPRRLGRLFRSARDEELLPGRPMVARILMAVGGLATAAGALFWVSLAAGWWADAPPVEPPDSTGIVEDGSPSIPTTPVAQVVAVNGGVQLFHKAGQTGKVPRR